MNQQEHLELDARFVEQLLQILSGIAELPDAPSILQCICTGLMDFPGVAAMSYSECPTEPGPSIARYPLAVSGRTHGELSFRISDPSAFAPYERYLKSLCTVAALALEERTAGRLEDESARATGAARTLPEQERLINAIADITPALIYVYDLQTRSNVYCNAGVERLLGFSPAEIQAMGSDLFVRLVHPDDLPGVIDHQSKMMSAADTDVLEIEYRMRHRQGGWRWLHSFERTFIRDPDGTLRLKLGVAIDDTERMHAEAALRESETRYRRLSAATEEGITIHDKGTILDANEAMARMFGYEHSELIGKNALELAAPESRDLIRENIRTGYDKPYEGVGLRKDGTTFPAEISGRAVPFRGQMMRITVVREITERKHTEQALRASERFRRLIVEAEPECVKMLAPDGRLLEMNAAGLAMIEAESLEQVKGGMVIDFVAPAYRPAFEDLHRRVLGGDSGTLEFDIVGLKGTRRRLYTHAVPLRNESNQIEAVLGVTRDITEHKRAEQALRDSEERYRLIVENAMNLIAELDMKGTYVLANQAHKVWLGYDPPELVGRTLVDFVHPDDEPGVLEAIRKTHSVGTIRYRHKSGAWRTLDVSTRLVETSQEEQRSILIGRDVTEQIESDQKRRSLEWQLQQSQKMEAIGTLAGGIAHDFNNVISVTLGNAELARMKLDVTHPARKNIDTVVAASERARDLVKQILTFSRRQEGKRRPLRVRVVLKEALNLMRSSLPTTIEIRQSLSDDDPVIISDPTHVEQIIVNLCTNAAHAMSEKGGILCVDLRSVTIDESMLSLSPDLRLGRYASLTVSDTGVGIDAGIIDRIFEPFFTTKSPGEGTGLGLAVVHGIVRSHGGAVTVSSVVGEGTTFRVYLPEGAGQVQEFEEVGKDFVRGRGERVLIVDDEPQIAELGSELLTGFGYAASIFTRPEEALRVFEEQPDQFDLVITDLIMPRITGTELARQVCLLKPGTPVVLMTGTPQTCDWNELRAHGVSQVLQKPFNAQTLAVVLHELLSSRDAG